MIQVEQRPSTFNQFFSGYQVVMSLDKSVPHQAILTVLLIETKTKNHYKGKYTFQALQPLTKRNFQNIQSLYNKFYDSIKNNDGAFTIEPNGRLYLIHQEKGRKCKSHITINTTLIQMNKLAHVGQAIDLLFSKSKQTDNLVLKIKQLIMNETSKLRSQFSQLKQQTSQKISSIQQSLSSDQKKIFQQVSSVFKVNEKIKQKNSRQLEQANSRIQTLKQQIRCLKINLEKVHQISIDKLQLTNTDPQQLNKELVRYRGVKFDQVCISNDRFDTALNGIEVINELSNLKNVTKLEIKWCKQMKAQVSMEILNTMSHLKQLALVDHFQKLSQNFMQKLCQFKQLRLFYINSNSHSQYYRSFSEDSWFIDLYNLVEDNLPSIIELLDLSKLPKLENIEISVVNHTNSAQVIKNMKSLRHLTLGCRRNTHNKVDAGLMQQLCEQRALITLSLIGLKVESKQVDHVIKNNPNLKTIIIRNSKQNENINDETVQCMANLIQLQNLCIQNNTAITGKHLSKLDKLIMLEIQNCRNVSKKEMKEALNKMHKLQHLNFYYNKWFDDEVLTSVQSCKELTYLNIESTSVSYEGLKHLEGLTRLNVLICGDTKINGKNLIELTKKTSTITRLSIFTLNVNYNELLQISAKCQGLTHLNIRETKIAAEKLLKIKQLKVLRSFLDGDSNKKLREAGIKTYR